MSDVGYKILCRTSSPAGQMSSVSGASPDDDAVTSAPDSAEEADGVSNPSSGWAFSPDIVGEPKWFLCTKVGVVADVYKDGSFYVVDITDTSVALSAPVIAGYKVKYSASWS